MSRFLLDFSLIEAGGSRSFTHGFLAALAEATLPSDSEFTVLIPEGDASFTSINERLRAHGVHVQPVPLVKVGTWRGRLRSQVLVPRWARRLHADCVYVPREGAPLLLPRPFVILARNKWVWARPDEATGRKQFRLVLLGAVGRHTLRRAAVVQVPSAAFGHVLPIEVTISVVHHGCDLPVHTGVRRGLPTADNPLRVLALGTVHTYKRFDHVIASVAALRERGVPTALEVWGPTPNAAEQARLRALGLSLLGEDPLRGPIDYDRRGEVLNAADVLAVGSSFESFGMATIEALRTSTVVWAPRSPLIEELCGPDAVTFDETADPAEAAAALEAALPNLAVLAADGVQRSLAYTWEHCVDETLSALESVARSAT